MKREEIIEKLRIDEHYYGDFGKQYLSNSDIKILLKNPLALKEPNKTNAIKIGPIAVPKEFTPPAKLSLFDPLAGSPRDTANGFAAVCCNENPKPIMNKATST